MVSAYSASIPGFSFVPPIHLGEAPSGLSVISVMPLLFKYSTVFHTAVNRGALYTESNLGQLYTSGLSLSFTVSQSQSSYISRKLVAPRPVIRLSITFFTESGFTFQDCGLIFTPSP